MLVIKKKEVYWVGDSNENLKLACLTPLLQAKNSEIPEEWIHTI